MANINTGSIGFSNVYTRTFQLSGAGKQFTLNGITPNYVVIDYGENSALDAHGGLYWETREDAVYLRTADNKNISDLNASVYITIHIGIPINS